MRCFTVSAKREFHFLFITICLIIAIVVYFNIYELSKSLQRNGIFHTPNNIIDTVAINWTNIDGIDINSELKIKVTTYGRIIDPNSIWLPNISIVNPSLIKIPNFINKTNRLGTYYLYFAHHHGPHIYLAISNHSIFGPYKLYTQNGVFSMSDTKYGGNHIASPDIHINFNQSLIEMYYHTTMSKSETTMSTYSQCTMKAVSNDGLQFIDEYYYLKSANNESLNRCFIYGHFYFRVFEFNNKKYAFAKNDNNGGILYSFVEYLQKWMILKKYNNIPIRHSAIYVDNDRNIVFLFITIDVNQKGIWIATINMYNDYKLQDMTQLQFDGIFLQSPAIYVENNNIYLLYCLNAEKNGIAISKFDFVYNHNKTYDYQRKTAKITKLLIWPRIPKTGGSNFLKLLNISSWSRSAYIEQYWNRKNNFTMIPRERFNDEYINQIEILNIIQKSFDKKCDSSICLIQSHIAFVPSITANITSYLFKNKDYNKINLYENWKYISMIRDPVKRIISSFNYIRGNSGGWRRYLKDYISFIKNKTGNMNIDQCINNYKNGENICKLSTNYYVKWFCGIKCDPFNITQQSLHKAIENIDNYFEWIGVLEFYDVSFEKFKSKFPNFVSYELQNNYLQIVNDLKIQRHKKGYKSAEYEIPSNKSLKILTKANELDYRLFHHVVEKYNYQ